MISTLKKLFFKQKFHQNDHLKNLIAYKLANFSNRFDHFFEVQSYFTQK